MRFEDGRIDQFVSDKKLISTAERDELFTQFRRRGRDFIPVAVQQVKNSYSGSDTGFEDLTEEQAEFIRRAGDLAENGYQDDPERIYAFSYGSYTVRFRVCEDKLYVTDFEER